MKKLLFVLFVLAFLPMAGCATEWTLRAEGTDKALQWPFQPERAKVTYVMSIMGFKTSSDSRSLLDTVVYGGGGNDDDAFRLPVAVSAGRDGRLAVADIGRKCVHLYAPVQRKYVRLYGAGNESFASPVGVAFDDELRLYVSDSLAGKVFVFGSDGAFLFYLRETSAGPLKRPTGIAYDPMDKRVYVADTLGNRINSFNAEGKAVFSFGERGEENGQFNFPTHIFFSRSGDLYVTDTMNFRIEIFDARGGFLGAFGRHGDGSGNFAMPKGVAADGDGVIYVVDSLFDTIQLFNRKGTFLLSVGKRGGDQGEFWLPSGLFIDGNGMLYVCDTYNGRVQVFKITEGYAND
jgi:DNA-binding beta-propeller fold protein YncE